jgi:hypothetical protein
VRGCGFKAVLTGLAIHSVVKRLCIMQMFLFCITTCKLYDMLLLIPADFSDPPNQCLEVRAILAFKEEVEFAVLHA